VGELGHVLVDLPTQLKLRPVDPEEVLTQGLGLDGLATFTIETDQDVIRGIQRDKMSQRYGNRCCRVRRTA
jgi:hypothetical protein